MIWVCSRNMRQFTHSIRRLFLISIQVVQPFMSRRVAGTVRRHLNWRHHWEAFSDCAHVVLVWGARNTFWGRVIVCVKLSLISFSARTPSRSSSLLTCRTNLDKSGYELLGYPKAPSISLSQARSLGYHEYTLLTWAEVLSRPPCWHCLWARVKILKSFSLTATGFPSWQIFFCFYRCQLSIISIGEPYIRNLWIGRKQSEHLLDPESKGLSACSALAWCC